MNNHACMPGAIPYSGEYLPRFPQLIRAKLFGYNRHDTQMSYATSDSNKVDVDHTNMI